MRDKIVHFYFGVDPQKVWLVVKRDLPNLKPELERILKEIGKRAFRRARRLSEGLSPTTPEGRPGPAKPEFLIEA